MSKVEQSPLPSILHPDPSPAPTLLQDGELRNGDLPNGGIPGSEGRARVDPPSFNFTSEPKGNIEYLGIQRKKL